MNDLKCPNCDEWMGEDEGKPGGMIHVCEACGYREEIDRGGVKIREDWPGSRGRGESRQNGGRETSTTWEGCPIPPLQLAEVQDWEYRPKPEDWVGCVLCWTVLPPFPTRDSDVCAACWYDREVWIARATGRGEGG